jgi:hypothetical protein
MLKRQLLLRLMPAVMMLASCASAPPLTAPDVQFLDHPPLGAEASAEIGETLLTKSKLYVFDGLDLQERITDNGIAREYVVEPSAARLERTDSDGNRYFVPAQDAYFVNDKTFGRRVRPSNAYLVLKANGTLELKGYYDLTTAGSISPAAPRYKAGKVVDRHRPNFRQELIYGGRSGNQIRVTYREFSGNLIRPDFTQEAQYDLGVEQLIGFKGVRIQVVSATNTRLVYRVQKSFPDSL